MTALLETLFDRPPTDLAAYFDEIARGTEARRDGHLGLLPLDKAVELTRYFRSFHPLIQALEGVILDEAENGSYHVYLRAPFLCGAVLHLAHDGDTRVVFASLNEFLAAAEEAIDSDDDLADFHPAQVPLSPDQAGLRDFILNRLDAEQELDTVISLIPSLAIHDDPLVERLVRHSDFFLGEAVGRAIAARPSRDLRRIAQICASHRYAQAANAGVRAVEAIDRLG